MKQPFRLIITTVIAVALLFAAAFISPSIIYAEPENGSASEGTAESQGASTGGTEASTEMTEGTYQAWINEGNAEYADFTDRSDYLLKTKRLFAEEGDHIELEITDPESPSVQSVTRLILYTETSNKVYEWWSEISVNGRKYVYFEMPASHVMIQVILEDDEDKILESEEEESRSIEESLALESSIQASIAATKRFRFGSYLMETDVSEVNPPKNFIRANDVSNFERTVGCFYSTDYRLFVYYAARNEDDFDYYVLDPIAKDLIPFITFPGPGNKSYIITSPESEKQIPAIYRQQTRIVLRLSSYPSPVSVPGFLVLTEEGETLTLLYLGDETGDKRFFVYKEADGTVELTEYEKYLERRESGNTDDDNKVVLPTDEGSSGKRPSSSLSRGMVWLIIIGVITVLIAAAFITVFIMSKKQEEKEAELDDEDDRIRPEIDDDESEEEKVNTDDEVFAGEDEPGSFESSLYKNPDPEDLDSDKEASGFDFENAFPEGEEALGQREDQAETVVSLEEDRPKP